MVENLFKKRPLQDLLSSLNVVISTNKSTRSIAGHVIYYLAYTYKFQLKTTKNRVKGRTNLCYGDSLCSFLDGWRQKMHLNCRNIYVYQKLPIVEREQLNVDNQKCNFCGYILQWIELFMKEYSYFELIFIFIATIP